MSDDSRYQLDRLSALPGLAGIPREELQWLLEHGEVHRVPDGTRFYGVDDNLIGLFVVISGRFVVRVTRGGVERQVQEVLPGRVTGFLPYTRMTVPSGYLVAVGPIEFLFIRRELIKEIARECYEFTAVCVHEMLDRARAFKAEDKRQEIMAALGRLSAGLAHELNNPASAATRAARELDAARSELIEATRELSSAGLAADSIAALEEIALAGRRTGGASRSPLDRAELEDRLTEWLDSHGVDAGCAYELAECGVAPADLDATAGVLSSVQLAAALRYVTADRAVRELISDISSATTRIHGLVAAVKKHTHMDRPAAIEPTRLEGHLGDTITLMNAKAALKGVSVELSLERDLPAVEASVAELNQVWLHLLDNAIDAVDEGGHITIDAKRDGDNVVVRIIDDGPGIPEDLQERVFEPFFTTKDVGEGRGLGLDIVRSVVGDHRGTVELNSIPGRTEFRVSLPACPA